MKTKLLNLVLTTLWFAFGVAVSVAQGSTAIDYQGRLYDNGEPANGLYDFRCQLYDKESPGGDTLVSITVTNAAVPVTNGLFVLNLDFGANVFDGEDRWLSVDMRTNNALNFTHLTPRQRLAPTPYAVYAAKAGDFQAGASPIFTGTPTFNPASGPPFAVGNNNKVMNLNADLLGGLDSTAFLNKAGDTLTGNLTLSPPASLSFGSNVRQMINLWGTSYGIGVQAAALYFRTDDGFAWFRDGVHSDVNNDPGAGGQRLMTLGAAGNLTVTATANTAVWGLSQASGIGVRGESAGNSSVGVLGYANGTSARGVSGATDGCD